MTFIEFAQIKGLLIRDLYPADRIQRCPTENKPRSTNGAYYWDGRKGWVMSWDSGQSLEWFESDEVWTQQDKQAWEDKRTAARMERMKGYALAAKNAAKMLSDCELKESPYLQFKGLGHIKAYVTDEVTLVPMRNFLTGKLVGLQKIWWNPSLKTYDKKFLPGMKAKGAVVKIGRGQEKWFVEGWATGISVYEALKMLRIDATVIVAFSAGNMIHVAQNQIGYVFADNDKSLVGEDAARATGLPWTMSEKEGYDANDIHRASGLICLAKMIQSARLLKNETATTAFTGVENAVGGSTVGNENATPSFPAAESAHSISRGHTGSVLMSVES